MRRELVSLRLMDSPKQAELVTHYSVSGSTTLEKVRSKEARVGAGLVHTEQGRSGAPARKKSPAEPGGTRRPVGRVYINKDQYFDAVPKEVWEFHIGGYQVCEKWLKDRKGRQLSNDDLMHYQKIVVALSETIRLMKEIDALIPRWPLP